MQSGVKNAQVRKKGTEWIRRERHLGAEGSNPHVPML